MANGPNHDTSDRYCDPCNETNEIKVQATSYCDDCIQFMCNKCYKIHERFNADRGHVVKTETDMPESQADKPPKFSYCDEHQKYLKNQFCSVHKQLICSLCSPLYHKNCSTGSVEDFSKSISSSETKKIYDIVHFLKRDLESSLTAVISDILDLNGQIRNMLKRTQELYNKIDSRAKKWFDDAKTEIDLCYQSRLLVLEQRKAKLCCAHSMIDSSLDELKTLRNESIDTKVFLRIQELLSGMNQCKDDLSKPISRVHLSFAPSKQIQDFLSSSYTCTMGSVKLKSKIEKSEITIHDIVFPVDSTQESHAGPANRLPARTGQRESARQSVSLIQLKCCKLKRYNVKLPDDKYNCYITGIAITNDGRRLLVDNGNNKVKLFSWDMESLSSLSLPCNTYDIAVLSDQEAAVVTTDSKSPVLLGISGSHMSINTAKSMDFGFGVMGISQYGEKLAVTSNRSKPPCVKMIDNTGTVYWSVSIDDQGQSLFSYPQYVTSNAERGIVTISDYWNNTLTVLNGGTGVVMERQSVKDKDPCGVTTGPSGDIYIIYPGTHEVAVLTEDLSEERILLSVQDGLGESPLAIAYDKGCEQLITSYSVYSRECNSIDTWTLKVGE